MVKSKASKKFERKHLPSELKRRKLIKQGKLSQRKKKSAKINSPCLNAQTSTQRDDEWTSAQESLKQYSGLAKSSPIKRKLDNPTSCDDDNDDDDHDSEIERFFHESLRQKFGSDFPGLDPSADDDDEHASQLNYTSEDSTSDYDESSKMHQQHIKNLENTDPEFYKYLLHNDRELLDFSDSDSAKLNHETNSDAQSTASHTSSNSARVTAQKSVNLPIRGLDNQKQPIVLTMFTLEKWSDALISNHSVRAFRELCIAFRSAAHDNEAQKNAQFKYSIQSPDIYQKLISLCLNHLHETVNHYLPLTQLKSGKLRFNSESKHFRLFTSILKFHLPSLLKLLECLSHDDSIRLTILAIKNLLPYFLSFKKAMRNTVNSIAMLWCDTTRAEIVRMAAHTTLHHLLVIADPGLHEMTLKTVYQAFVSQARHTTPYSIQQINMIKNLAAQLWGVNFEIATKVAYRFLRYSGLLLYNAMNTKNNRDSFKQIYNWQYVHSLDFWARIISVHCNSLTEAKCGAKSPMNQLIYPLTQLILGTMRLIPSAQYIPLRFLLIRTLLAVSEFTDTYIPLAAHIYEVLDSSEMRKAPKPSTLKPLDFNVLLKVPQAYLHTRALQDCVGEQVYELMTKFFSIWATNIAFPELCTPFIVFLKQWHWQVKQKDTGNKNAKVNAFIYNLVEKMQESCEIIETKRIKGDYEPTNVDSLNAFSRSLDGEKLPIRVLADKLDAAEKARKHVHVDSDFGKNLNLEEDNLNATSNELNAAKTKPNRDVLGPIEKVEIVNFESDVSFSDP